MDNGYFLTNLEDQENYINALTKRPWNVLGHYLTVQPWPSSFNSKENFPAETLVWIRLPNMPLQYHKSTLRAIANIIRDLIKIDYKTESVQRGKFARMAVRVNLNKPFISRFKIEDSVQMVESEDLLVICY